MPLATSRAPSVADLPISISPRIGARIVVLCDLSIVGLKPLALMLTDDHRLVVERPEAAHVRGVRLVDFRPAVQYDWQGGMPLATKIGVPDRAPYSRDDYHVSDPVAAVLLRALGAREPLDAAVIRDVEATGRTVWARMWAQVRPALDPRAWSLAVRFGYRAPVYTLLATTPAIMDAVERFPVLGPFVTSASAARWPEAGASPRVLFAHVFPEARTLTPTPGQTAWLSRLPILDRTALPTVGRSAAAVSAVQRAVVVGVLTTDAVIRADKVAAVDSAEAWCLLHTALVTPGCVPLVPVILENPTAAVNAVHRGYLGQQDGADDFADLAGRTVVSVRDWMHAEPDVFARAQGFARLVRESDRWHRECAGQDRASEQVRVTAIHAAEEAARRAREEAEAAARAEAARQRAMQGVYTMPEAGDHALFPNPPRFARVEQGDLVAEWLCCADALVRESDLANHCIGRSSTYHGQARASVAWHFTIRTDRGEFLATTTIRTADGTVEHCLGTRNGRVSPSTRRFAELVAKALVGDGALPARAQGFAFVPPDAAPDAALLPQSEAA